MARAGNAVYAAALLVFLASGLALDSADVLDPRTLLAAAWGAGVVALLGSWAHRRADDKEPPGPARPR